MSSRDFDSETAIATFDELSIGIRGLLDVEVGVGFMIE